MPPTRLWAVNNKGKVYTLSTNSQHWQELDYFGLDFKRLSAVQQGIWALGGDHQLYIYILASDVPIRYKEVTYENQRWNPVEGFSDKLLFTDRPAWSSEDGLENLPKESFTLPSANDWVWESDWFIEENIDGSSTDPEGWKYALDFPRHFSNDKRWNSYVRRRKWVRYRKFSSTNSWVQIPSIHPDPLTEPLFDISIGGFDIPGQPQGHLCVWAITVLGHVVHRCGVVQNCPEGHEWKHIPTPQGCEINQISVGPLGLVWVISWDGQALVRLGVSREDVLGTEWAIVQPPNEDTKLSQVAVGTNVVWAISRNGKVWFRKGIRGSEIGTSSEAALGNGWVEMVGEMALISVGQNDQVWALSADDKTLYFRSGVTPSELSGKTWRPINLPHKSNFPSSSSDTSLSLLQKSPPYTDHKSIFIPYITTEYCSSGPYNDNKNIPSDNSCTINSDSINIKPSSESGFVDGSDINTSILSNSSQDNTVYLQTQESHSSCSSETSDTVINFVKHEDKKDDSSDSGVRMINTELIDLVKKIEDLSQSEISLEDNTVVTTKDFESERGSESPAKLSKIQEKPSDSQSLMSYDSHIAMARTDLQHHEDNMEYVENEETSWAWISANGCVIDAVSVPNWFTSPGDSNLVKRNYSTEPWMAIIIQLIKERNETEIKKFSSYALAIDKTAWIKTGKLQFWRESKPQRWVDCNVELEQGNEKSLSCGNFSYSYFAGNGIEDFIQIPLREVNCCVQVSDRLKPVFAIYTAKRTVKRLPYLFATGNDAELEDWVSSISNSCCEIRNISKIPRSTAIWSATTRGDIFISEPLPFMEQSPIFQYFWHQIGGHLKIVETCCAGIVWGIGYDHTAWVYTGGFGGGIFKGIAGSNLKIYPMTDVRNIYIYENQRWNPLTGYSTRGLPTDRYMWSDKTGRYECLKANTQLPSTHWNWISDWAIDYNNPGGVDRHGWQYAHDFPRSFHAKKKMTDYVRRRRWFRRCKLVTTAPFKELEGSLLLDVSFQVDGNELSDDVIAVWAIAFNGDTLCRLGVQKSCPQGLSWEHVASDRPFQSVSVGGSYRVWTVAIDGSAYFRNGVSKEVPTGLCWFHVEPPCGSLLRQISAGKETVWAVDQYYNLWFRKDIVSSFPEGTAWIFVSGSIRQVSVGPDDQVWAIADFPDIGSGPVNGIIARRRGITKDCLIGTGWEYGIGGGWQHICIRGVLPSEDLSP